MHRSPAGPLRALCALIAPALLLTEGCNCNGGGGGNGGPGPIDTTVTCDEDPPSGADAGHVHGTILKAEDDAPLAGAVARLEGVTGCVTTDADGEFAIAVPGGGRFNLALRATDRTHARRVGTVTPGHDVSLGTIALRGLDAAVSQIGSSGGTHESDEGGLTLSFPAGALSRTVNVRATRFNASRELPAPLPETSHFTMALEATAEAAELAKPVQIAIPNDYGFPPGTSVPVGVFDEASGEWIPDGMGVISADGTQVLYEAGHFSSFDCNYPTTVSDRAGIGNSNQRRPNDPCERNGSTGSSTVNIKSGNLTLDLQVPLGRALDRPRALTLVYQSTAAQPSAWIGGERAETPADLSQAPEYGGVEVQVEGQRHKVYVDLADGANWAAYLWDGTNARGERVPTGLYDAWLRVFYGLRAEFAAADVFGGPPTRPLGIQADEIKDVDTMVFMQMPLVNGLDSPVAAGWFVGGVANLHFHPDGMVLVLEGGESRGVFEPAGRLEIIGGGGTDWDCADGDPATNDCFDDPVALAIDANGDLLVGDTGTHTVRRITAAGTLQTVYDGAAEDLQPQALAVAGDGTLYIGDGNSGAVFRLTDGALDKVCGGDVPNPFDPENKPTVSFPTDLEFGPGGELYIADWPYGLRRLDTDGTLVSLTSYFEQPDPPAPFGIAVTTDGSVLMSETNRQRVRRLWPDGTITNVAGLDSESGYRGDGGLATQAWLDHPADVALGADGRLYVADEYSSRVRAIDLETGIIKTVAGMGPSPESNRGEGGPATDGMIWRPVALTFDGQGRLLVGSAYDEMVFRIDFGASLYDRPDSTSYSLVRETNGYTITRADGTVERFDADGRLTERSEGSGRTTEFTYDTQGRLSGITDALDETVTLAYGDSGLVSVTDPHGRSATVTVDDNRDLTGLVLADGTATTLSYDGDDHRLTGWEDGAGRTAEYRYDTHGRIEEVQNADGHVRTYEPLESQSLVNNALAAGQGQTADDPAPARPRPTVVYIDGAGQRFEFLYDALGEMTEILLPDGSRQTMQNSPCGMPALLSEPDGRSTTRYYDDWGRLLQENTGNRTIEYVYDPDDPWELDIFTDRFGRRIRLEWDEHENITAILYSSEPRFTMGYTDGDNLEWLEDATGVRHDFEYDTRGNLTRVSNALANDVQIVWDARGNVETIEDPVGGVTRLEYDDADRVIAVIDADSQRHDLQRDGQGLLTAWTTDGVATTLGLDGAGRPSSIALAGAAAHTITRDGEGRVTELRNPLGDTVSYAFDRRGRGTGRSVTWSGGSETATYAYDDQGHLASMTDEDSSVSLTYGSDGNVLSVTQFHTGMVEPITLTYDTDEWGRVQGITYPALSGFAGGEYTYEYEHFWGYVSLVWEPDWTDWALARDDAGRITELEVDWGEDWEVEYARDAIGRIEGITVWADYDQTATLYALSWTLAADGKRLVETGPDGTATYSYDPIRRLAGAAYTDGRADESYTYDPRGDRSGAGYEYNAHRRMTRGGGYTYDHDDAGRVIRRTRDSDSSKLELTWDGEDKLIQVDVYGPGAITPDHVVRYRHDAEGKRIAREVDGVTVFLIYDREDVVLEIDESGAALAFYLHGPGADRPLAMIRGGERYAYVSDELGTVRGLARLADRTIVRTYEYSAFGELLSETGTLESRYGFHGRERDPLTGLIHMRAREYDPATGRFLSLDPMMFVAMSNPYIFPGDDAVNFTDPEGTGPPRGARAAGWVAKQYNGLSSGGQNLAGNVAARVGGRGTGEATKTVWEYAVQPQIDGAVRLPGYSPGPGPSVSQIAEWGYEAWTAKNPCDRAKVGGKIFKWVARNNPRFNKAVDKFIDFSSGKMMGR